MIFKTTTTDIAALQDAVYEAIQNDPEYYSDLLLPLDENGNEVHLPTPPAEAYRALAEDIGMELTLEARIMLRIVLADLMGEVQR